jgi:hypothetical protein
MHMQQACARFLSHCTRVQPETIAKV